jgi:signal transduction histidine kinase
MLSAIPASEAAILRIPTLNDKKADFIKLFQLGEGAVAVKSPQIIFDFTACRFLRQNAVAFLGGLTRLLKFEGKQVLFDWATLQDDVQANLCQNGFRAAFEVGFTGWQGNSIPYREDPDDNLNPILEYLDQQWLGRGWVQIDEIVKDQIVSTVLEIYCNAFEHGQSPIGTFSCGQRYPKLNVLKLTTIDFGVGIPANVCDFLQDSTMQAEDALKWAFQLGKTTRQSGVPGGIGLDMLKTFVKEKQGKIEIYSHDGYALIDATQEFYESFASFFKGTLINVTIPCDLTYYNRSRSRNIVL